MTVLSATPPWVFMGRHICSKTGPNTPLPPSRGDFAGMLQTCRRPGAFPGGPQIATNMPPLRGLHFRGFPFPGVSHRATNMAPLRGLFSLRGGQPHRGDMFVASAQHHPGFMIQTCRPHWAFPGVANCYKHVVPAGLEIWGFPFPGVSHRATNMAPLRGLFSLRGGQPHRGDMFVAICFYSTAKNEQFGKLFYIRIRTI